MTRMNPSDPEEFQRETLQREELRYREAGPRSVAVAADPGYVRRIVYLLAATLAALTAYTLSRLATT